MSLLTRTIWLDVWKIDILSLKQKVRSQRHFVLKDMQKISPMLCVSLGLTVGQSRQNFWRVEERFYFFQKEKTEHVFVKRDWEALLLRAEFLRNQRVTPCACSAPRTGSEVHTQIICWMNQNFHFSKRLYLGHQKWCFWYSTSQQGNRG